MSRTDAYIVLTVRFVAEDDVWTAECEELGTAAFGDTLDEAKKAIEEMIALHLNSLERTGMRAKFFRKHGIRLHKGSPSTHPQPRQVSVRPGEFVHPMTQSLPAVSAR